MMQNKGVIFSLKEFLIDTALVGIPAFLYLVLVDHNSLSADQKLLIVGLVFCFLAYQMFTFIYSIQAYITQYYKFKFFFIGLSYFLALIGFIATFMSAIRMIANI